MSIFEKSILEKNIEKAKDKRIEEPIVEVERREEDDFHSKLREELREKKKGNIDVHFSQIDPDQLTNKALDIYEKYKREKDFEKDLCELREKTELGDPDYNFLAMLENWSMHRYEDNREKVNEKEQLRKKAEEQIVKIKKNNTDVEDFIKSVNFEVLRKTDFKAILGEINLNTYEEDLKTYFRNMRPKNKITRDWELLDLQKVTNSPIYHNYLFLCHLENHQPFNPEIINQ